ncbi:MAG: hypothetical protein FWD98_08625, partial [Defluviitaleaceae bacterium]|nr:hypothetical protein [Defluviitaleaceae bacterium]
MSNMVVRTNVLALNSHRNLGMVGNQQARASARLSSGFRINSAADDAAGLGISENMRAQIRGLDQASRNAQDGISMLQTAEGGLSTITEMVTRIRELTVQAANDVNTAEGGPGVGTNQSNRARIQGEINHLIDEIERTATTLQFNGMTLLDGSLSGPRYVTNDGDTAMINGLNDFVGNLTDLNANQRIALETIILHFAGDDIDLTEELGDIFTASQLSQLGLNSGDTVNSLFTQEIAGTWANFTNAAAAASAMNIVYTGTQTADFNAAMAAVLTALNGTHAVGDSLQDVIDAIQALSVGTQAGYDITLTDDQAAALSSALGLTTSDHAGIQAWFASTAN